jgi:hypothetical protein
MSSSSSRALLFPAGAAPLPISQLTPRLVRARTAFMALSPSDQDVAIELMAVMKQFSREQLAVLTSFAALSSVDQELISGLVSALQPSRTGGLLSIAVVRGPRFRAPQTFVAAVRSLGS